MQATQHAPRLAMSKVDFGANPELFDGYIERRLKRQVDFNISDKLYTVNAHGVLCSRTVLADGKFRYSFCATVDELFNKLSDEREFAESLSFGRDRIGLFFKPQPQQQGGM